MPELDGPGQRATCAACGDEIAPDDLAVRDFAGSRGSFHKGLCPRDRDEDLNEYYMTVAQAVQARERDGVGQPQDDVAWLGFYEPDEPAGADIVYRVGGDGYEGVLFAKRQGAERVGQIRSALFNSKTWGQLRASLPDGEWEDHFAPSFEADDRSYDDLFEPDCAPGFADGDYPEWLLQSMLDWFPKKLIKKYGGSLRRRMLNGDALELPAAMAEQIAKELRAMGNTVEKTDLDIA